MENKAEERQRQGRFLVLAKALQRAGLLYKIQKRYYIDWDGRHGIMVGMENCEEDMLFDWRVVGKCLDNMQSKMSVELWCKVCDSLKHATHASTDNLPMEVYKRFFEWRSETTGIDTSNEQLANQETTDDDKDSIIEALLKSGIIYKDRGCYIMELADYTGYDPFDRRDPLLISLGNEGETDWLEDWRLFGKILYEMDRDQIMEAAQSNAPDILDEVDQVVALITNRTAFVKAYVETLETSAGG